MRFSLQPNKKIYFASDLHLIQAPDDASRRREKDFVKWLDSVKADADAIFLLGDMFDFWFEYRNVVPRGFTRLLGKLGELTDAGIPIHFFTGNHDLWVRDYLSAEIGMIVHRRPTEFELAGKRFLIGHGHGLGPTGFVDQLLQRTFNSRFLRVLFASVHPRRGIAFGKNWSINNRRRHGLYEPFEGPEKEEIAVYICKRLAKKHYDFFIFGHRHLALDMRLSETSRYINTGEWIEAYSYAVFDGTDVSLHSFKGPTEFLKVQDIYRLPKHNHQEKTGSL